jgi:cytochrome P450
MTLAEIDLSDTVFWSLPLADRAAAFALLREQPRPQFYAEPDVPFSEKGPGYYALVRHADVVEASRHADVFCSGNGATSIMRRTLTCDYALNGQDYRAGDKVVLFYYSANRDEAVFADPDRFDITRTPNPHVGFGAAGPHYCLGAHLARRELNVMLRELLTRVPDITAGEPDRLLSSFINGIKRLPCQL